MERCAFYGDKLSPPKGRGLLGINIKEITYYPGTKYERKSYFIQKRLFGFLWWFDPYEDGLYGDGRCSTYEEALKNCNQRTHL